MNLPKPQDTHDRRCPKCGATGCRPDFRPHWVGALVESLHPAGRIEVDVEDCAAVHPGVGDPTAEHLHWECAGCRYRWATLCADA